jgi:hypothetical protein
MISFFYYVSARRRLVESNKTIRALGGENESPPMILAQNEMLHLEIEYHFKEFIKETIYTFLLILVIYIMYTTCNECGESLLNKIGEWYEYVRRSEFP